MPLDMAGLSFADFWSWTALLPALLALGAALMAWRSAHIGGDNTKKRATIWAACSVLTFLLALLVGAIGHHDDAQQVKDATSQAQALRQQLASIQGDEGDADKQLKRIASGLQISTDQSARNIANQIISTLPSSAWHLTSSQETKLGQVLDSIPKNDVISFVVHALPSSISSLSFANSLGKVFQDHKWPVTGTQDFRLNPELLGLYIGYSDKMKPGVVLPEKAQILIKILRLSGINFSITPYDGVGLDDVALIVGSRNPK